MSIITNDMRGKITQAVLKHGFAADLSALLAAERPLIEQAYERLYPPKVRELMAALCKAQKHALGTRRSIDVNVQGMRIRLGGDRGRIDHLLPKFDPLDFIVLPDNQYGTPDVAVEEGDDVFGQAVYAHAEERSRISSLIETRRAEITGVLREIRTDRQLEERWPEVLPIASQFIQIESKIQLPAVPVKALNDALGLPPVPAAAELEDA